MKYTIQDKVTRFVKRFGMIMDPETMNKAKAEAGEYDFRRISEGHYAVQHKDKMYVIIERDGEIGCSCDAMTFNRMDGSACKHIIEFSRLLTPVVKEIEEGDRGFLVNACGWTGKELHPEIELGGPGAVIQEDTSPAPDEPEGKIYTRRCQHCDEVYSGKDLDKVKKELADHLKVCGMNPRAKPHKQTSDPEKKDPEPEKKKHSDDHLRTCQYCGMSAARKYQSVADAWLKKHEASCPKNPENALLLSPCQYCGADIQGTSNEDVMRAVEEHEAVCPENPANASPEGEDKPLGDLGVSDRPEEPKQKSEEVKKMEDKPAWDQAAWDNATQGSFVSYGEDGIAKVLFTSNDFGVGKPDKWGRVPCEFSVIQHNKSVILSVGAIGLMHALKEILPLEGKLIKIIRTGEGTGTKYEVQDVTDTEVI